MGLINRATYEKQFLFYIYLLFEFLEVSATVLDFNKNNKTIEYSMTF